MKKNLGKTFKKIKVSSQSKQFNKMIPRFVLWSHRTRHHFFGRVMRTNQLSQKLFSIQHAPVAPVEMVLQDAFNLYRIYTKFLAPFFSIVTWFLDTFGAGKCVRKHQTQDMVAKSHVGGHTFTWIRAAKVVEALTVDNEIWNIEPNGFGGDCSYKKWKIKEKCHLILWYFHDLHIYIYLRVCVLVIEWVHFILWHHVKNPCEFFSHGEPILQPDPLGNFSVDKKRICPNQAGSTRWETMGDTQQW